MKYLFILCLIGFNFVLAQDSLKHAIEIGGNLQYNYTNTYYPDGLYATSYDKLHTIIIQPEFGYFVYNKIEIIVDLEYTHSYLVYNSLQSITSKYERPEEIINTESLHRIGIFTGIVYNISFNNSVVLFGGIRLGLSSSRSIWTYKGTRTVVSGQGLEEIEYINEKYDTGWRPREFSFPSFMIGTKFFLIPDWAIILKAQYTKTYWYDGYKNQTNDCITLGIGFVTLLKL